jgi:hypothetical protein
MKPTTTPDCASLFDAMEAREAAIARCGDNNADWCTRAYRRLLDLATERPEVLVEHLKDAMGADQPATPSAYGPVLRRAAREGVLERAPGTRYALSVRSHSERATWRSRLCA